MLYRISLSKNKQEIKFKLLSKMKIETLVYQVIEASCSTVTKRGKNYYIKNPQKNIQITVN
ncbi:DUF3781 domain-containing protein [Liquorilactobacillus oeni]|uniref:DUF3781 domain-containing protein n=1 Tax=Liquorilactobacillus oeni TaxID=303241 RepID=UPI00070CEC22